MNIEQQLRILARSTHYQNLYKAAKEININLFENQTNFSGLQSLFLFWLSVYDSLYTDLNQKEWKYLDDAVIESDIRCDAFLYWRSQTREQEVIKYKREQQVNNLNLKDKSNVSTFNVDFQ
jgi:hypothetical protein